jgi:hypothetical protein
MPSSEDEALNETRFSNMNPDVQTHRVMFDVAALPAGSFPDAEDANSVGSGEVLNLRRQLFADETSGEQEGTHEVTLPSESNLSSLDEMLEEITREANCDNENINAALGRTTRRTRRYRVSYA